MAKKHNKKFGGDDRPKCRACKEAKVNAARGLCWRCFRDKDIRAQYPSLSPYAQTGEPTQAELEKIEATQRKRLPAWWAAESAKAEAELRSDLAAVRRRWRQRRQRSA